MRKCAKQSSFRAFFPPASPSSKLDAQSVITPPLLRCLICVFSIFLSFFIFFSPSHCASFSHSLVQPIFFPEPFALSMPSHPLFYIRQTTHSLHHPLFTSLIIPSHDIQFACDLSPDYSMTPLDPSAQAVDLVSSYIRRCDGQ
jgi:hypothetical protein